MVNQGFKHSRWLEDNDKSNRSSRIYPELLSYRLHVDSFR